jgi:NAD(P)-dependent dehydrogenase (short-subunit alcohol dehydrogenase family)
MTWKGKAVVITGGAMGIGRYIALGAAERGANVAIGDINEEGLRSVEKELLACGNKVVALKTDVRKEGDAKALMDEAAREFGAVDCLINNAAIVPHFQWGGPRWPRVREMKFSFWSDVIATNLHGTFLCTKFALPYMERQRAGHIVNVYGGGGLKPPGSMTYVITKEAGVVFSRYLAEEVREHNVCVLSMSPGGAIATERAPQEARDRMPSPVASGDRFFLAAEAGMEFSGHVVDLVAGNLAIVSSRLA